MHMAPKVQVQPGFMPAGDDVMALVAEVGGALRTILKNEQAVADLKKSENVATSDAQTLKEGGAKGKGENVATSDAQTLKAERSPAENSSSGGGALPVKKAEGSESSSASPSAMRKGSPSPGEESSSPSASGSPSAGGPPGDGAPPSGDPSGAPPAGDPSVPSAGGEAPSAEPTPEELVQMYSQLAQSNPESFQAHVWAMEQAAQAAAGPGAGAPGAPGAGAPPAGPPGMGGPPSAGPPPSAPPAGPPGLPPMGKSEAAGFMAELKKTQDQLGAVAEAVTAMLTLPKRKAMTGLHIIPFQKSEPDAPPTKLSFTELRANPKALHAELTKMTLPDSGLKKSERDLVTDFYCHRISVNDLAPLFQDKK